MKRNNLNTTIKSDNDSNFVRHPYEKDIRLPPQLTHIDERQRLNTLLCDLNKIARNVNRSRSKSNLTTHEVSLYKNLRRRGLIFIRRTRVVNFVATIEKHINAAWHSVCRDANISKWTEKQYKVSNSQHPKFYFLPKTHKGDPLQKVRPIVSCTGAPDRKITWLLTFLLSDLVKDVASHLCSSTELMDKIKSLPFSRLAQHQYPMSLDVTALYTSCLLYTSPSPRD